MTTTENNKIIAEFMDAKYDKDTNFPIHRNDLWLPIQGICNFTTIENGNGKILQYHKDWNWLMEVVEKIESLTDINTNGCFMVLESIGFNAKFILDDGTRIFNNSKGETKIEVVYNACVEFIKWYNQQKE